MDYKQYIKNRVKMNNMGVIDPTAEYSLYEIDKLELLPSPQEGYYLTRQTLSKYVDRKSKPSLKSYKKFSIGKKTIVYIKGADLVKFAKEYLPPYRLSEIKIKK